MSPSLRKPRLDGGIGISIARILALAVVYFGAARLGLSLAHYHENATLVWPPAGIALATLLLYGVRLWPGVFLGAFLTALTPEGAVGLTKVGIAAGNTLEAVIGALLLARVADFRPTLERVRDVFALLLIGALGCGLVGATVGVATLALTHHIGATNPWMVWLIWWLGDAGGVIIMTPVLLTAVRGTPAWPVLLRSREFWLATTLVVVTSAWSVSGAVSGPLGFVAVFVPFPVAVWAGARLGPRGAVLASFLIVTIATLATALGISPFVVEGPHTSMLMLWTYGVVIGATALTLAAAIAQRDHAERRHRSEEAHRLRAERAHFLMQERERLTREMHDGLGGQLVSTIAMLESGSGSRAEVIEELRRALDDMRIVIDTLDPRTTSLPASLGKLRARIDTLLRRNDIRLRWTVADDAALEAFPPEDSLHVLRIIQEAVTNAIRHAAADEITVELSLDVGPPGVLSIEVRDDGCGPAPPGRHSGHGIRNMKQRAEALGGELVLEPCEPGTRVRVRVPFLE